MKKINDPFKVRKNRGKTKPSKPKPSAKDQKKRLAEALKLIVKIEGIKECYRELDSITQDLLDNGFTEGFIDGQHIVMKDLFSSKNTVWKSTPQRRFQLEIA